LRQSEVQSAEQKQAVQALQADAGRSESSISELRSELKRSRDAVQALEVSLADTRARADAAKVQADTALATSREFLTALVAAREEQRRQLAENGASFAEASRRLTEIESRLQAQQRLLQQTSTSLNDASRRLVALESSVVEAGRKSAALEAKAKTGQETDATLTRQLQTLRVQVDETRSVINSEGLMKLQRELQGVQRDTAVLRGSIEDLQHAHSEAASRARNQYLDLDTRIQALKQKIPPPANHDARSHEAPGREGSAAHADDSAAGSIPPRAEGTPVPTPGSQ